MVNFAVFALQFRFPKRALFGLFSLAPFLVAPSPARAQLSECEAPATGEYLLFVQTPTADSQLLTRRILPSAATAGICRYQGNLFTRIGGFRSAQDADKWGRYVLALTGLSAAVVEPTVPVGTTAPPLTGAYNPQPLGPGYAVLVDYFNQPQLAEKVRQAVGREVGLVSYFSRPYLLALYTSDRDTADKTLRLLSERGFSALTIDSSQAMLLAPTVRY